MQKERQAFTEGKEGRAAVGGARTQKQTPRKKHTEARATRDVDADVDANADATDGGQSIIFKDVDMRWVAGGA